MDRWSGRGGKSQRREEKRREEKRREKERRSEKRKSQKKEYQSARKGRKVAKHCVFSMFWGSGGSNSRLAKAAGAEPSSRMIDQTYSKIARRCGAKHIFKSKCAKHLRFGELLDVETSKKCMQLWREAHFEVKMFETPHARRMFEGGLWIRCQH